MESPLVSVIMTVKNGSKFISASIGSVISQTLSSWELLIIDDYSKDSTLDIIHRFTALDSRVKCFENKIKGRGEALNYGLELAKGKYISVLDADDLMHPHKLKMQVRYLDETQHVALVSSGFDLIQAENDGCDWKSLTNKSITVSEVGIKKLCQYNPICHSSVLVRSKTLKCYKYNSARESLYDYELWLRLASDGQKLTHMHIKLTAKRIHAGQHYEHAKHFKYILQSISLQAKYLMIHQKYYLLPFLLARILWASFPSNIRLHIKRILRRCRIRSSIHWRSS